MPGLEARVRARLDARLNRDASRPLAVGLSGGSDSLALAEIAAAWAGEAGRPLLILTVDHQLRPESADWTRTCAGHAHRLGARFQALAWTGDKPAAGLPAAARAARHRLLAEAAREHGAEVILLGHTADDLAESARMRAEGGGVPDPREWAPSPVWPEGRGVLLLRPLLAERRADLRAWLSQRGLAWIEDPANFDLRYARARARAAGAADAAPPPPATDLRGLAAATRPAPGGGLALDLTVFRAAPAEAQRAFLGVAALCASGTARPPRGERLGRALLALEAGPLTLAGARITVENGDLLWRREAGEMRRRRLAPLALSPSLPGVWDGRLEFISQRSSTVTPLAGQARRLPPDQARARLDLPAAARAALPALEMDGALGSPLLGAMPGVSVRDLAPGRLAAACGLVERES